MERAAAARCLSEAGRHYREAAATTTVAVTGTAPGVSTGDTGPYGTGSVGPGRWEGRVTSREGGPKKLPRGWERKQPYFRSSVSKYDFGSNKNPMKIYV